mmetsp:Transcript_26044/g.60186  ORF Transcript_26044/g.60186 Transcript_26044/m.60186 type:complete len:183 (+) Transcript_26044:75-623(+)
MGCTNANQQARMDADYQMLYQASRKEQTSARVVTQLSTQQGPLVQKQGSVQKQASVKSSVSTTYSGPGAFTSSGADPSSSSGTYLVGSPAVSRVASSRHSKHHPRSPSSSMKPSPVRPGGNGRRSAEPDLETTLAYLQDLDEFLLKVASNPGKLEERVQRGRKANRLQGVFPDPNSRINLSL